MKAAKKRVLSLLLAFILVFAMSAPALAAEFSDVGRDHWAHEYISALSGEGYFSGYEDGTFRPNGLITQCETLVLLSRFYKLSELDASALYSDYSSEVKEAVPSLFSWAYNELSVCLAAGIISKSELKAASLGAAIDKKTFSLYLVRAMGLGDDISEIKTDDLPFADEKELTGSYRGSVALLYSADIVDGDDANRFNPSQKVNRAVASTLLYRSIEFIKDEGVVLEIPAYSGSERIGGIIRSVSSSKVTVELLNGVRRELSLSASSRCKVNGASAQLTTAYIGCYADIVVRDGAIVSTEISKKDDVKYITGIIRSTSATSANRSVTIQVDGENGTTKYNLNKDATVTLNNKSANLSAIHNGFYVVAELSGLTLSAVKASDYDSEIKGQITALNYGSIIELRVQDSNGAVWNFDFNISELPDVYLSNYEISIDRLNVGDAVSVELHNGKIKRIVGSGTESTLKGEISSVIDTVSGLYWEITDSYGSTKRYPVSDNVAVYRGKTSVLVSTVKVGTKVEATVFNSTITSANITTSETAIQTGKVSGSVLNVDTTKRQIIILVSDKLFYINLSSSSYLYNAASGRSTGLVNLTPDSYIVAYGDFESSTVLDASMVVVEAFA